MKKAIKIIKIVSASIIMGIIIISLDISSAFPVGLIKSFLKSASKFINSHSDAFFFVLGGFFFLYFIFDVINHFHKNSINAQITKDIKNNQKETFDSIDLEFKKLDSQIRETQDSIKDDKNKFENKSLLHSTRICNTLNSINLVYDHNLAIYHETNKKLYHIASKTTIYSQNEIKPLLDKYQNINL